MLKQVPSNKEIETLIGKEPFKAWISIIEYLNSNYAMDTLWNSGRNENIYELKFRKSGKTLCSLYPREKNFGFMVIYGKNERSKFEAEKQAFSKIIQKYYDEATTYHDGKWIMISVKDSKLLSDFKKMLQIKKKPCVL